MVSVGVSHTSNSSQTLSYSTIRKKISFLQIPPVFQIIQVLPLCHLIPSKNLVSFEANIFLKDTLKLLHSAQSVHFTFHITANYPIFKTRKHPHLKLCAFFLCNDCTYKEILHQFCFIAESLSKLGWLNTVGKESNFYLEKN